MNLNVLKPEKKINSKIIGLRAVAESYDRMLLLLTTLNTKNIEINIDTNPIGITNRLVTPMNNSYRFFRRAFVCKIRLLRVFGHNM